MFIEKKVFPVTQKKELVCVLPFIGKKLLTVEVPISKVHTAKFEVLRP